MRFRVLTFAVFGLTLICLGQAFGQTPFGELSAAVYENGSVLGWAYDDSWAVTFYRADGTSLYSRSSRSSKDRNESAWAVDGDGFGAVGYRDPGEKGHIDLLDASGKLIRTIDTGIYLPTSLVFAADHSVWSLGFVDPCAMTGDFKVLRHYARSGEKLGEAVAWPQLGSGQNTCTALQTIAGGTFLFAGKDRIGFVSFGVSGHQWTEVTSGGEVLGQYALKHDDGEGFTPMAMTAEGKVYGRIWNDDHFLSYGLLDEANRTWHRISGQPTGRLIGADGNELVFWNKREAGLQRVSADRLVVHGAESVAIAERLLP